MRPALIIEGQCPNGHGPLERRDDNGWCDECGNGWSIRRDTISLHIEVKSGRIETALGSFTMGAQIATFTPSAQQPPAETGG